MKLMLPIRIVFRVPPGATERHAWQAGRPLMGRVVLVLSANTAKSKGRHASNNALRARAVNAAPNLPPATQRSIASTAVLENLRGNLLAQSVTRASRELPRSLPLTAARRCVPAASMARSTPRKAKRSAATAPADGTVAQSERLPTKPVPRVRRGNTARETEKRPLMVAVRCAWPADIPEGAPQVVLCAQVVRPRNLANPFASRASLGPSLSPESVKCARLGPTRA